VTRVAGTPAGSRAAAAAVCTACPLLCNDIAPGAADLARTCAPGAAAFATARVAMTAPAAWSDGVPCSRDAALDRAATALGTVRRVLVTGLAGATLEGIAAACDLAETLGAAIDPAESDMGFATGPTIARVGGITAEWEELRDRADLVILWFCDPATTHPRFIERFVTPALPSGTVRRTIAVGPGAGGPGAGATETARSLLLTLEGHAVASADDAVAALHAAIDAAECVAIVTGATGDPLGLDDWSVAGLVRHLAHRKPAFQVPLGAGVAGGGANVAGAAAVCTWRYGAAGAIARANRAGSLSLPGEADAVHLIARGEVDCVIAIGPLAPPVEEALAASSGLTVIRVNDEAEPQAGGRTRIQVRAASLLVAPEGTMLRGDGRWMPLAPDAEAVVTDTQASDSLTAIVADLHDRVRAPGGRS
jgi:formylmethanofuran dehydrogenase subunit B